ncbi:hypothetical protein [Alienimonas sp. DA493]|uniref:hypothetical protein n=1 Tax=Alienimonas sp. DA493 TaxID=3373605 RepID=UPI0037540434
MNDLQHITPEQVLEVADAAEQRDSPQNAKRDVLMERLEALSELQRRELCAVMNAGRGSGSFGSVAAFREGRVGNDKPTYFTEKQDLADSLRDGLTRLSAG